MERYWEAGAKTREEPQQTLRLQGDHGRTSQEHRQKRFLLSTDSEGPLSFCQLKPTQIPGESSLFTVSTTQGPSEPVPASQLF